MDSILDIIVRIFLINLSYFIFNLIFIFCINSKRRGSIEKKMQKTLGVDGRCKVLKDNDVPTAEAVGINHIKHIYNNEVKCNKSIINNYSKLNLQETEINIHKKFCNANYESKTTQLEINK